MSGVVDITKRGKERRDAAEKDRTLWRDIANTLLRHASFRKWAGDVMVRNGFFDSRELTPYAQGVRGGIVKEIERLMELADSGDEFLASVFRDNILKGRGY